METYKDFVYLKIPKKFWEKWLKEKEQGKRISVPLEQLLRFRSDYISKNEKKRSKALKNAKKKQLKVVNAIYKALENYYNGLFKENKPLNKYQLSKLSRVSYPTILRFWEKHKLDDWIEKFEANPQEELKKFKIQELSNYFSYL